MFKKGDAIVYGQTGVCIIEDIVEKTLIKNTSKQYYLLKPFFQQNYIIYAPTDSTKVNIRPVMTKQQADDFICKIPEIAANVTLNTDEKDYRSEFLSQNCCDLVELTAKLYNKKKNAKSQNKKLGFVDEKYLKMGEELLFSELAFALDIPISEVQKYIKEKIGQI